MCAPPARLSLSPRLGVSLPSAAPQPHQTLQSTCFPFMRLQTYFLRKRWQSLVAKL